MKYRDYIMITHENSKLKLNDVAIVSKALLEAARRLQLTNAELAKIVGISESKLSRMSKENAVVSKSSKEFDLALLFIRLYRSLDAITGGASTTSAAWVRNQNKAFNKVPLEQMKSLEGLVDVVHYLDSRRAII